MKAYPGLPADANVEAWLVTIAHRKTIDVTRTRARRAIPGVSLRSPCWLREAGGAGLERPLEDRP